MKYPRSGSTTTQKGYIRITSGPNRHRYEHRVITAVSLQIFCPEWLKPRMNGDGLPSGFHVHHQDHRRAHNCPQNLMLLDAAIHDYLSLEVARRRKYERVVETLRLIASVQ